MKLLLLSVNSPKIVNGLTPKVYGDQIDLLLPFLQITTFNIQFYSRKCFNSIWLYEVPASSRVENLVVQKRKSNRVFELQFFIGF